MKQNGLRVLHKKATINQQECELITSGGSTFGYTGMIWIEDLGDFIVITFHGMRQSSNAGRISEFNRGIGTVTISGPITSIDFILSTDTFTTASTVVMLEGVLDG